MRRFARVVALVPFLMVLSSADADAQRRFEGDTSVVVVEVPVQVTRDGRPVKGLTAADFEVRDSGKKVPIIDFDVVDLNEYADTGLAESGELPALSPSARRHFLLFFDLSFSAPDAVLRARQAARQLVLDGLNPTDVVGVATYRASVGAQVVLGFTSDRNQIAQAIAGLGLAEPHSRFDDPLGIVIGELDSDLASRRAMGGARGSTDNPLEPDVSPTGTGRLFVATDVGANALANAQDLEAMGERQVRDQQQSRILGLSSAMDEVAQLMKSVQGRVHVVFLSEGFDSSVMFGNEGGTIEDQVRLREIGDAAASGEFWRVDSDARFGSGATQTRVLEMLRTFRSADCTIQAVDIGGVRAGIDITSNARGQNGLYLMANETGGELYRNYNNLGEAMGAMLERSSVTYVLAFQPKGLEHDGSYHRLEVSLKRQPKGTRVVHRPGYFEPRPAVDLSVEERRLMTAGMLLGPEGGALELSVLAAPFRTDSEKAYVPVFIEVGGPSLLEGTTWEKVPLEIYAYVFDRQGNVRDFFAQAVGIDLHGSTAMIRLSGYKFWGQFDLPPGDYTARVLVRNISSGATGLEAVDLHVPEANEDGLALLPPFFPDPVNKWVLGRERERERRDTPHPYMVGGKPVLPAARPVVWPEQQAEVRLLGYNLGDGELAVEGRLRGDRGVKVPGDGQVPLRLDGRLAASLPGLEQLAATLDATGLKPGDYSLEITVRNKRTQIADTTTIPLRVQ